MARLAEFDIVVHGASGFTGGLIVEHLAKVATDRGVSFALSGRDVAKLAAVRDEMGADPSTTLIAVDSRDADAVAAMVGRTRAVITAAGPFQLYGEPIVSACATAGADYLDLSGEVAWMRQMIDTYRDVARASGARIMFSCGFDSIPFELGVLYLQSKARERFGVPVSRVRARIVDFKGGMSGGTVAAGAATMAAAAKNPAVAGILADHFALTPGFAGPEQPGAELQPTFDDVIGQWTAPFVMAPINTRNVHRSNFLQGHPYGIDFAYDERIATGPGKAGEKMATHLASTMSRDGGPNPPKPGEGPSKAVRDAGYYHLLLVGLTEDGRRLDVTVHGDRDPGYGSTSKIITETAIFLEQQGHSVAPGIWTPGAALGMPLAACLEAHAGLSFAVS